MSDKFFSEISDTLSAAKSVEDLTRPLLSLLEAVTELEATYLTCIDQELGVQRVMFAYNSKTMQIPEGLVVPWEGTLCKRALDEGRFYTDDVPTLWGDCDAAKSLGIQTYVSTPVRLNDGRIFGTLCAAGSERKPLTPKGEQVLRLFSSLIGLHVEREQLLENLQTVNTALEAHSFTDVLTGLPNRRFLLKEMERLFSDAEGTGQTVLIAFIDLDGFKAINDRHGHEIGDEFLIEVGKRLSAGLRAGDILARFGGDEFIVTGLGPSGDAKGQAAAEVLCNRLAPLLVGDYALRGTTLHYSGASFGPIASDPRTITVETALRNADAAMYEVKRKRKALRA
ncbi:sensor domain-containing diguanylate cyclase [Azospirillum sp. A26]|uniref:sensor domain-containing diguanylate cyclase n=1 Tax=Azospirillum sp. A26 TaxID=3160607 RepID=UPI003672106F